MDRTRDQPGSSEPTSDQSSASCSSARENSTTTTSSAGCQATSRATTSHGPAHRSPSRCEPRTGFGEQNRGFKHRKQQEDVSREAGQTSEGQGSPHHSSSGSPTEAPPAHPSQSSPSTSTPTHHGRQGPAQAGLDVAPPQALLQTLVWGDEGGQSGWAQSGPDRPGRNPAPALPGVARTCLMGALTCF